MKGLWLVIAVMAVANLLALVGFVVWLGMTDRLSTERIEQIREMLAETVPEQEAREAKEEEEAKKKEEAEEEEQLADVPPLSAADRLRFHIEDQDLSRQQLERMRREIADLRASLTTERGRLDERWATLRAEQEAFEEMRDRLSALEGDKQFRKAVRVLESMRPRDATATLTEIIEGRGDGLAPATRGRDEPSGVERAVAYLNAMAERPRSRVMSEFVDQDAGLAAELLERLGTHGQQVWAGGRDPDG